MSITATTAAATYYVKRNGAGMLELRQTRFLGGRSHPHDVCAVARDKPEMQAAIAMLKGSVDWSRVPG